LRPFSRSHGKTLQIFPPFQKSFFHRSSNLGKRLSLVRSGKEFLCKTVQYNDLSCFRSESSSNSSLSSRSRIDKSDKFFRSSASRICFSILVVLGNFPRFPILELDFCSLRTKVHKIPRVRVYLVQRVGQSFQA
jgi:hypothetical protein